MSEGVAENKRQWRFCGHVWKMSWRREMKPQSFRGAKQQNKLIFQVHIAGSAGKLYATRAHMKGKPWEDYQLNFQAPLNF